MGRMLVGWAASIAVAALSSAAVAQPVVFSGSGAVTSRSGDLPATGTAVVGDAFRVRLSFDPSDAALRYGDADFAAFALPLRAFEAAIGDYRFSFDGGGDTLFISRCPASLCGEASRTFSFNPTGAIGADAPFGGLSATSSDRFNITATFKDLDPTRPVSIADIVDPASASFLTFDYVVNAGATSPVNGVLSGTFSGGFEAVAAVPEPATWIAMLFGFGATGYGLRRSKGRTRSIYANG